MATYNPQPGDAHVKAALTNYGQHWMQADANFVAVQACPILPVQKQSDRYHIWDIDDMNSDDAAVRGDAQESQGGGFKLSQDTYFSEVIARHADVGSQLLSNADPGAGIEKGATAYATRKVLIRNDGLFASKFMGTGIWGTDVEGVATGATGNQFLSWSVVGPTEQSDPVQDIDKGKEQIGLAGMGPGNCLVLTVDSYRTLRSHPDIKARLGTGSGATGSDPGRQASVADLERIFELDSVYVFRSIVSNDGVRTYRSTNSALLYRKAMGGDMFEPTAMTGFAWTGYMGATASGYRMKSFYMDKEDATRYEAESAVDFKVTSDILGYYFDKTVTP